ncbi:fimbria/pilus outer membrane usher protein [Erwinia rhapontici]|uniref:fimbria/pilus outer membrane usher protein n=1 Tax=Erwinia rhapontici TaxID=55212 RepID=UPI001D0DAE38|nr:fimbria/pilus outer membrane usher protein [Erwinia rhapontici]UDQ79806.1 fimbria/pilus outer membrane usher protein [Erwinia rhapontici]
MSGSERFTLNAYCHCALLAAAGALAPTYLCAQEETERPQLLQKAQHTAKFTEAHASGESVTEQILRARGIDPTLLNLLDNQARFPAGPALVDISVNGEFRGAFNVVFNQDGGLCFTPELFHQLGLTLPGDEALASTGCFDWAQRDPAISIRFEPQNLAASLVVPDKALLSSQAVISGEKGGVGALLNYNYFTSLNRFRGNESRYSYLTLEDGFNVSNWMVRSWQQFNLQEGALSADISSMYAERSFERWQKRLLVGQIGVSNTLFELGEITGMQIIPDEGFQQDDEVQGIVEGIASTPQARVEVRQYGMLIYNTLVPAGPFRLDRIPLNNLNSDLDVSVLETNGQQQHFTVPANRMMNVSPSGRQGISLAAGKLRSIHGQGEGTPAILTMNRNWKPFSRLLAQTGLLLSDKYQSVALSLGHSVSQGLQLAAQITAANDRYHGARSARFTFSADYRIFEAFSVSASVSKNTPAFASINQASQSGTDYFQKDNTQYSLSANWVTPGMGIFSISHAESRFNQGMASTRYNTLGWGAKIKKVMLSVNFSHSKGTRRSDKLLSVNANFPLGRHYSNTYYRSSDNRSQLGSEISGPVNRDVGYNLSTERDLKQHSQSVQGGLNANLHYTTLSASAGRSGSHSDNYSVSGSGSVAMVGKNVLFSPIPVGQTFGMIAMNERLANVAISTPGGTVWTDWRGLALAPQLPAWRPASLDLDTETLPKKSDVNNGHHSFTLARGSVKRISYTVLTSRRVLLDLTLSDGTALPRGSKVMDEQGTLLTIAIDNGLVYLNNSAEEATLLIDVAGSDKRCSFTYRLEDQPEDGGPYQKISGVCI